jgi:hypothetical protein
MVMGRLSLRTCKTSKVDYFLHSVGFVDYFLPRSGCTAVKAAASQIAIS